MTRRELNAIKAGAGYSDPTLVNRLVNECLSLRRFLLCWIIVTNAAIVFLVITR